jgi:hypothetical protein
MAAVQLAMLLLQVVRAAVAAGMVASAVIARQGQCITCAHCWCSEQGLLVQLVCVTCGRFCVNLLVAG